MKKKWLNRNLRILVLIKNFGKQWPKHKPKFDTIASLEKYANVKYWYKDGSIFDILKSTKFKPDFILQYDVAWENNYSPKITGLDKIKIPKGCIVGDIHYSKSKRIKYIESNKIDLIFSNSKKAFIKNFPQYRSKFRWLPFAINPDVFKDWNLPKSTDYLLMGQVYCKGLKNPPKRIPPKGRYPFREAVLKKMLNEKGFVFNPHPGHFAPFSDNLLVNENYAKELNKSKIFFTCGGKFEYPVAKFFEAPACKTLLLAKPNNDILELGFKDGVNFISCNESNFYEKAKYYINNKRKLEEITNAGYTFVHNNHTNQVRSRELINYIIQFLEKERLKSLYKKGSPIWKN